MFAEQKRVTAYSAYAASNEFCLSRGGILLCSGTEISRRMFWSSVFCVARQGCVRDTRELAEYFMPSREGRLYTLRAQQPFIS